MTVEEMFTIVLGEIGWVSFISIITIVILLIAVGYLAYRLNQVESLLRDVRRWQRDRMYL